ncbi:MAG: hypothetical protein JOY80_02480 [Candidatus Dormibacteraeota bacterium]|nr:hypothetical protein [Candidatus Dormibacteraeota bacterium]
MSLQDDANLLEHRTDQRVGLAWTPIAGSLLPVAVTASQGEGRVIVTSHAALQTPAESAVAYVRSNAARLAPGLDGAWLTTHDIAVSQPWGAVPANATPDDWADAGAAVAAALISLLSGHMVRTDVAVTGALTPSGELVAVGGFTEKTHAATDGYVSRIVAPAGNQQAVGEIPDHERSKLEFVFAASVDDLQKGALAKHPLKGYSIAETAPAPAGQTVAAPQFGPGRGQAVVLTSELGWYAQHTQITGRIGFDYDLTLRVHFGDGTSADIARHVGDIRGTDLTFSVGDIVPVRFDPDDRSTVEIDVDAMHAAKAESQRRLDDGMVRAAEETLQQQESG